MTAYTAHMAGPVWIGRVIPRVLIGLGVPLALVRRFIEGMTRERTSRLAHRGVTPSSPRGGGGAGIIFSKADKPQK